MMSGVYDNWERLVDAVLKREQLRQLAYCESLSSSISSDFSSRLSSASSREDASVGNSASGAIAGGAAAGPSAGGIAAGGVDLFAAPAIGLAWYGRRRKKPQDPFFDVLDEEDPQVDLGLLNKFSLRELQVATDNFSSKNIISRGGYGNVHKGRLTDGSSVAVKRLKKERTIDGELEFQKEVRIMSMVVHRNLLTPRGFCLMPTGGLLVYPFMVNGSVASCLRERPESKPRLDWPIRKRIALGSARGLAFMHDHCDPRIIHGDVRVANILLDEDFEAALCSFKLAKFIDCKDTHLTTAVRGTIGHIAPDYLSTGKCSEKTDVFSYGVMLLELITGQRTLDHTRLDNGDDLLLLDLVRRLVREKNLETLVDADLQGNYIDEEVEQLIQVAFLCTQSSPLERPKMSEVIRMLEGDGLAERWEEWRLKEEMLRQDFYRTLHLNTDWDNIEYVEMSKPR